MGKVTLIHRPCDTVVSLPLSAFSKNNALLRHPLRCPGCGEAFEGDVQQQIRNIAEAMSIIRDANTDGTDPNGDPIPIPWRISVSLD